MSSASNEILDCIEILIEKSMSNANFDRTRTGIVVAIEDNNFLTVNVDNKIIEHLPYIGNVPVPVNTSVRVLIPENQFSNSVVLGASTYVPISGSVTSVNGKTGAVVLVISDIANLQSILDNKYSPQNPPPSQENNSVKYIEQILTDIQKLQARKNIDAKQDFIENTAFNKNFETDVSNIKMDGIASDGILSTVPRADHIHPSDISKLSLSGGDMSGNINMNNNLINNLVDATQNQQPITYKQFNDAIGGLGSVFKLKGTVLTPQDLPSSGNSIGDVWYVESESVGYIWLQDSIGVLRWEKFGQPIDLSGYVAKNELLQSMGQSTVLPMSQKATTDSLNTKYSTSNPPPYPVTSVNNKTGNISLNLNDLSDVVLSNLQNGNLLGFNGIDWKNIIPQFAHSKRISATEANNASLDNGLYSVEEESFANLPSVYNYLICFQHKANPINGYGAQIAVPFVNGIMQGVWYRVAVGQTYPNFVRLADALYVDTSIQTAIYNSWAGAY